MVAHFLGLCAAIRYIGVKTVPLYAPLALLMERIAAHFGRFSTNKPTIEPTKTQESDERTQGSANEPEVRIVAPSFENTSIGKGLKIILRSVSKSGADRRPKPNPRDPDTANEPGPA
jgi:hypothetical protein